MPRWQKLIPYNPEVTETRLLADEYYKRRLKSVRVIKPSIFLRGIHFLFFLLTFACWLLMLFHFGDRGSPLRVQLGFVVFLLLASLWFLRIVFVKKYNYTIQIDASGLTIREIFTPWDEIVETAIKRRGLWPGLSGGEDRYLVIFKRNEAFVKATLFLFGITDWELASAVEYYKTQASR